MSIYKIAEITGYSPSVVARALRNSGYCSEKKRQHILEVAEQINYHPNQAAKSLRMNKTKQVLFCIPDICNPFYFEMIDGVLQVLEKNGYTAMLFPSRKSITREKQMIERYQSHYYDGIIFVSFDFCEENIEAIRRAGVPTVLTNRYTGQRPDDVFDYVFSDHHYGMRVAVEHLLDKGCRDIVILSGDTSLQTSRERYDGYCQALREHGMEVRPDYLLNGDYDTEQSYAAFSEFMATGKPVDGVVASNDLAALGVLRYCREHGIPIPDRIKVVSFDNTEYARITHPALTSIDLKQYDIGVAAANLLIERLENGRTETKNCFLQPVLFERDST